MSRIRLVVAAVTVLIGAFALPGMVQAASAATITVNTSGDEVNPDGNCSLREAIQSAETDTGLDHCHAGSGTDTIVFATKTNGHPINLTLGSPQVTTHMTIEGNGSSKTRITGSEFVTNSGAAVTFEKMTLVDVSNEDATVNVIGVTATAEMFNNSAGTETSTMKITGSKVPKPIDNNSAFGTSPTTNLTITKSRVGSITNNSGPGTTHLTVTDSTAGGIHNNTGTGVTTAKIDTSTLAGKGKGPGISLNGTGTTVTVFRSTIDHFTSGISMDQGTVNITDSTISHNKSSSLRMTAPGGAVHAINDTFTFAGTGIAQSSSGSVTLTNTIVALNKGKDCKGTVHSSGGNIADDSTCHFNGPSDKNSTNPQLGPLQNNGGPTHTELPKSGSPAIDKGLNSACPKVDQRGIKRPQDGNGDGKAVCDVGSVEVAKK
jgi:CSLREA domain-containing protein